MDVQGKSVLITGAGGSLGRALAVAFARKSCRLMLCDIDEQALARTAEQVAAYHGRYRCFDLDLAVEAQVQAMFEQLAAHGDAPDIVVNNAGLSIYGSFWNVPTVDWERLLDVNVNGVFHVTRHALPHMLAQGRGHLVFISSLSGVCATPGLSVYAASKHAINGFAESLYAELRPKRIGVSVICPSDLKNDIAARMSIYLESQDSEDVETWRAQRARRHSDRGIPCDVVAQRCLRAVSRQRFLQLVGVESHAGYHLKRLLGPSYMRVVAALRGSAGHGNC